MKTDWFDFRSHWGMPEKSVYRCPKCGVETKKGMTCNTHRQREHNVRRGRVNGERAA